MCKKQLLSLLPLVVLLSMSRSGYAANVLEGRKLAEQWCAKCHNIEKGAPFKLTPPSFASIATYRTYDSILGKVVAPSQHSGMPETQWLLQREDFDDLLAYITLLEIK